MSNSVKRTNLKPLSVSGGYWTGASAVVDLLHEHHQCAVVPGEFMLFSFGQWFQEVFVPAVENRLQYDLLLSNHKRYDEFNKSDLYPFRAAGRRFFSLLGVYPQQFFSKRGGLAAQLGASYVDSCAALSRGVRDMPANPDDATIDHVALLVNGVLESAILGVRPHVDDKRRIGVFDQMVAPPYIDAAEAAVPELMFVNVDRDWRDQYISLRPNIAKLTKINERLGVRPLDEIIGKRFDGPVQYFLNLRKMIGGWKAAFETDTCSNKLWIDYERVVLDTRAAAKEIFEFLELDEGDWSPGCKFHPEVSRTRIGKWKQLGREHSALLDEIEEISETLGKPDWG